MVLLRILALIREWFEEPQFIDCPSIHPTTGLQCHKGEGHTSLPGTAMHAAHDPEEKLSTWFWTDDSYATKAQHISDVFRPDRGGIKWETN